MAHKNLTPPGLTSLMTTSHTPIMTFINTSSHILSKAMLSRWSSAFLSQNTARWQLADPSGTPRYHYCRRAIVPRSDFKGPHYILMHPMMNQLCTPCLRVGLTREKGIAPSTPTKLQFLRRISHRFLIRKSLSQFRPPAFSSLDVSQDGSSPRSLPKASRFTHWHQNVGTLMEPVKRI